jgi:hypothetical protein
MASGRDGRDRLGCSEHALPRLIAGSGYAVTVFVGFFWLSGKVDDAAPSAFPGGEKRLGFVAAALAFTAIGLWTVLQWSVTLVFLATPVLLVLLFLGVI